MKSAIHFYLGRRAFFLAAGSLVALSGIPRQVFAQAKPKIGIIGAGGIGGGLGELFAKAGYPVMLSARDLGPVRELATKIGANVQVGTPQQAAAFGEVVIVSVPFGALAQIGHDYAAELKEKVVLDTANANEARDGAGWDETTREMAKEALAEGTGVVDQKYLPGTRLVKAFNVVFAKTLISDAHHPGELMGVPLASDDKVALDVAKRLVTDIGYEPVEVGGLSTAKLWDTCHPTDKGVSCEGEKFHGEGIPASQVRTMLGVK
jgi:predicted dinucleotide-binding enzyme